jgi:hypothetical protein
MDAISRRRFAEQLALAVAAPYFVEEFPLARRERGPGGEDAQQQPEPSPLAIALAETVRLRYPDRFSADDLAAITRSIDNRLRQIERLYQTQLTNADEPDFVYAVYRGAD